MQSNNNNLICNTPPGASVTDPEARIDNLELFFRKTTASVTGKAKYLELSVLFALQLVARGISLERWTGGQPSACTKRSHERGR